MKHVSPKKSLGQNFLVDRNIAEKIVRTFDPAPGEEIVEIGPGEGALTGLLVDAGASVTAVELDREAADAIEGRFGSKVRLIRGDFLKVDLHELMGDGSGRIRVIGNIPYYITSPILFRLIDQHEHFSQGMLMMQKEVAERLTATPRTKDYGILSVVTQTYGRPQREFNVAPGSFYPRPSVTSTVVSIPLLPPGETIVQGCETEHRAIVRSAFGKRRKTLNNGLSELIPDARERERIFADAGIDPRRRPEELTIVEFGDLARILADARAGNHGGQADGDVR